MWCEFEFFKAISKIDHFQNLNLFIDIIENQEVNVFKINLLSKR